MDDGRSPAAGAPRSSAGFYRTDHARSRSVRRRANPWYRRLARGIIALALLGALGVGLYLGAEEFRDWLNRDRLPSAGAEIPEIRSTSFRIESSTPSPNLDGTITVDTTTGAYEFVGASTGPQAGVQVVSPDGQRVYVRRGIGAWAAAGPGDTVVVEIGGALRYLLEVDDPDDILINRLRQGYVTLVERATEGVDDDELIRYEMTIDSVAFDNAYPLQWSSFQSASVPAFPEAADVPLTMWLDREDVVVRLQSPSTNWSWQRLAYTDEPFQPSDPAGQLPEEPADLG